MLSEPAKTVTPAATSRFTGGIGTGPGPFVMIATPACASAAAVRSNSESSTLAEREGMADGDAALQASGFRPRRDLAKLEAAERPRIVQVDIDADAVPLGDREDRVEMAGHVVVDAGRIESADEIGALADRVVEKIGDAGARDDAALRERDDLDVDQVADRLAHLEQRMQTVELNLVVDVDMRAKRHRAVATRPARRAAWRAPRPGQRALRRSSFSIRMRSATLAPGRCGWKGRPSSVLSRWICPSIRPGRTQRAGKIDPLA